MEDHHEKLEKEEIDRTKLSPTATELIAKYGNASTIIGGTFVLVGDFDYRDKAKKELEDYIYSKEKKRKQKEISMKDNEYETIDILTDLFTYITVGAAVIMIISLLIRAAF